MRPCCTHAERMKTRLSRACSLFSRTQTKLRNFIGETRSSYVNLSESLSFGVPCRPTPPPLLSSKERREISKRDERRGVELTPAGVEPGPGRSRGVAAVAPAPFQSRQVTTVNGMDGEECGARRPVRPVRPRPQLATLGAKRGALIDAQECVLVVASPPQGRHPAWHHLESLPAECNNG